MKTCPVCAAENKDEAVLCLYCNGVLPGDDGEKTSWGVNAEIKEEVKKTYAETWEYPGTADIRVNQKKQVSAAWAFLLVWALFLGSVFLAAWYAIDSYQQTTQELKMTHLRE